MRKTLLLIAVLILTGCSSPAKDDGIATASGSVSATTTTKASSSDNSLKFAQCMREHGIQVDDPKIGPNGEAQLGLDIPEGTDPAKVQAAQNACKQYLPNGGEPEKANPEHAAAARKMSQCMRDHGIKNFPDPDASGGIAIKGERGTDLDPDSPKFKAAQEECQKSMPGGGAGSSLETGTGK